MGRVILCTGRYATTPYCFDKLGIRVWSAEELCCCLYENAFLLDEEIVSARLVEWLDKECSLSELAKELYPLVNQKESLTAFVFKILEFIGFYDGEALTQVSQTLQSGASLSDYEKKKKQGDFFVQNQKYGKALMEYERLLSELPGQEQELRAEILHNKGVAFAGLFLFEEAATQFLEAYHTRQEPAYYRDYLAAKRMLYDDEEYISFVAELPDAYDASLQLEREVDQILNDWECSTDFSNLEALFGLREEGSRTLYYEETEMRLQSLKEHYRECILL